MKNNLLFAILLCLLVFVVSCPAQPGQENPQAGSRHYMSFSSAEELEEYFHWSPGKKPMLVAHRGGPMLDYPENCLETFENILSYAPCIIECDIRKTRDGVLILLHDEELEETTTGTGNVSDRTLEELKSLQLKCREGKTTSYRIPTLSEALEWARGKAILELDVKRTVAPEEVVALIQKHKAQAYTVVIAYSWESAQYYHSLDHDMMISASARGVEGTKRLLACGVNHRKLIGFVGVTEPEKEVYDLLHENGICAILGTLGNLDKKAQARGYEVYIEFLNNGADILATDDVPLAQRALNEYVGE